MVSCFVDNAKKIAYTMFRHLIIIIYLIFLLILRITSIIMVIISITTITVIPKTVIIKNTKNKE